MSKAMDRALELVREAAQAEVWAGPTITTFMGMTADQLAAKFARAEALERAVAPLARIADAYDRNELDDEARKWWGAESGIGREYNGTPSNEIELYSGRGGKRLLTLADCQNARLAMEGS